MRPAEKCRKFAAECCRKARRDVGVANDGALLLEMAAEWERLAEREEREAALRANYLSLRSI